VPLHLPFRERRARRVGELTLAAVVALSVIVTPGLIHGRGTRSNQAAAVAAVTPLRSPAPSTPSRLLHHHHWTSSDAARPASVSDERAFRHLWATSPAFRMRVTYAHATPRRRAALRKFFHPKRAAKARAPRPAVVVRPAARAVVAVPAVAGWTVWDTIAACESSGNWHDNTGNGYSGGLQFSPSTWSGYGGGQFAAHAWQASREQQIVVAERIHAAQGSYRAWPVCGTRV
jgi:Transglycosylase-like domain